MTSADSGGRYVILEESLGTHVLGWIAWTTDAKLHSLELLKVLAEIAGACIPSGP
jgi:hypothetical protein